MKLITIREYSKQEGLSEQGSRKRISSKLVKSVQLDYLTYIVAEDKSQDVIKGLKNKVRLLSSNIKTLKAQVHTVVKQDDEIEYLRNRVKQLEDDLRASTHKKEELYEKVITTVMLPK